MSNQISLEAYGISKTEDGTYKSGTVSEWLKADMIGKIGTDYVTKIVDVREHEFDDGKKILLDVDFKKETTATMVLNKTNLKNMLEAFGEDMDKWKGQQATIKVERTIYNGKDINCLRIYG